jgi:Glycosyl transferases group 1
MPNAVASIVRAATRGEDEPLNIICMPTHERFETGLCLTGHNFFAFRGKEVKDWNKKYSPLPENYTLLNPEKGNNQLPLDVSYDLVLSQNKFGQFQIAKKIARALHLPLVSLEHTLPHPTWSRSQRIALLEMAGDINVFISNYSRREWGFEGKAEVIEHGIDAETFKANANLVKREARVLSVVNDFVNRDWCCGYKLWKQVTEDLPSHLVGATPGLSKAAGSIPELVIEYAKSSVFLNTSQISPVPTALLEAMSCGCAIVTAATCMIPEFIEDGVNGYISNEPFVLRSRCQELLANPELAKQMGESARRTILDKFSMSAFVSKWKDVFKRAADITYKG